MAKRKGLNAGEWGELYVLLRLVGDGRLALTDENEQPLEGCYLDIMDALRYEKKGRTVRYIRHRDTGEYFTVVIVVDDAPRKQSRSDVFSEKACEMLDALLNDNARLTPELRSFFEDIEVTTYKAVSQDKSDIFVSAHDPRSGLVRRDIGYSVKTKWAQPSTLFNTGNGTRSVYRLIGDVTPELIERVNSYCKPNGDTDVRGRWAMLAENGIEFEFVDYALAPRARCHAFTQSLELMNPYAIRMFEQIVRAQFEHGLFPKDTPITTVNEWLIETNPCGVSRPALQYEYMLKTFLYAAHSSLTAGTPWDGRSKVNGGLITVDREGRVLAYNALDGDVFKTYLFNHTCMDYPSTGRGHGNYGFVYYNDEVEDWCFDLNFQIRYSHY